MPFNVPKGRVDLCPLTWAWFRSRSWTGDPTEALIDRESAAMCPACGCAPENHR
jgi:hypothetical protein